MGGQSNAPRTAGSVAMQTFVGLYNVLKNGIAIGELMSSGASEAFIKVVLQAHHDAWDDIMMNDNLNEGQTTIANMIRDSGSSYIQHTDYTGFNPETYHFECRMSSEAASQALGRSIDKATLTVTHAGLAQVAGLDKFLTHMEIKSDGGYW